ncbi:MAG: LpqN/LpqT family lipoprotein [Mycobacterium sp.]
MRTAIVAPVLAGLVFLTGCGSSTTDGEPEADHSCVETSVPLSVIAAQAEGEPELKIPQPPGWNTSDQLNSQMIRFTMVNTDLTVEAFAPNAVVTMETAGAGSIDAGEVFDQQRQLLKSQLGATDVSAESGLQCGYPATTISYTAPQMGKVPQRQAKVLCVLAKVGNSAYLTTVTLSSVDPANPTYAADSEAILSGFQVIAQ